MPIRLSLNRSACRPNEAAVPACLTSAKADARAVVPAADLLGEDLHSPDAWWEKGWRDGRQGLNWNSVRTGIIEPRAKTLGLSLLIRSGIIFFCFFVLSLRLKRPVFAVVVSPIQERENFGHLSARFNSACSYGRS